MKLPIKGNTVSAENQFLPSRQAMLFPAENPKHKIGIIGNSILCHEILEKLFKII